MKKNAEIFPFITELDCRDGQSLLENLKRFGGRLVGELIDLKFNVTHFSGKKAASADWKETSGSFWRVYCRLIFKVRQLITREKREWRLFLSLWLQKPYGLFYDKITFVSFFMAGKLYTISSLM
ncbi:MAG: hypothetical protein HY879_09820 [Deltaproteobacteria bacterium]|nr:hypothetical protein [Deltaproteobacteria bacterium]